METTCHSSLSIRIVLEWLTWILAPSCRLHWEFHKLHIYWHIYWPSNNIQQFCGGKCLAGARGHRGQVSCRVQWGNNISNSHWIQSGKTEAVFCFVLFFWENNNHAQTRWHLFQVIEEVVISATWTSVTPVQPLWFVFSYARVGWHFPESSQSWKERGCIMVRILLDRTNEIRRNKDGGSQKNKKIHLEDFLCIVCNNRWRSAHGSTSV